VQRNIDNIVACVFCFTCSIAMSVYLKCICWITKTYYTQWIQEGTTYIIVDWRFITKTYGEMRAAFEKHLFLKIPRYFEISFLLKDYIGQIINPLMKMQRKGVFFADPKWISQY